MIGDAIEYPSRGDDPETIILVGTLLNAFWWLFLIPTVLVNGYYVNVLRQTIAEEGEPPSFSGWGRIAKDGVILWVIYFVYFIIPTILTILLVVVTGGLGALTGNENFAVASIILSFLLAFVVGGTLYLLFGYFAFAAVTNYADKGRIGSAFEIGDIVGVAMTMEFFKGWAFGLLILVVGLGGTFLVTTIIGFVLGLIPIVGLISIPINWIIWSFAAFIVYMVAFRAIGRGYYNARNRD